MNTLINHSEDIDTFAQGKGVVQATVAIRDRLGLLHPIHAVRKAIQSLRRQRVVLARSDDPKVLTELVPALDAAIAEREALLRDLGELEE